MAQANNYFNISGNLVRDPEIKLTTKRTKYCFITLAVNGIGKDRVDFIRVCFWENLADNIKKYCHKGDCLTICGHISTFKRDNLTEQTLTADGFTILRSKKHEPTEESESTEASEPTEDKTPTKPVNYGDVFSEVSEPFTPFT